MSRARAIPRRSFRTYGFAIAAGLAMAGDMGAAVIIGVVVLVLGVFLE